MPRADMPFPPASLGPVTAPVYHYTTARGLIGLADGRVLWASEASSLNDLAEVRAGWDVVEGWATRLGGEEPLRTVAVNARKGPREEQSDVFVACCSTASDDAAQWRSYAEGGAGYAVELDPTVALAVWTEDSLASITPTGRGPAKRTPFERLRNVGWVTPWYPVIYDEAQAETMLDEILELARDRGSEIANTDPTGSDPPEFERLKDQAYEDLRDDLGSSLSIVAHLIKSPGFSGEQEVRAFADVDARASHLQFRPSANGVVAYLTLTAASGPGADKVVRAQTGERRPRVPLPIRSVKLGSKLLGENAVTVERLLAAHALKGVPVTRSKLRMR